MRLKVFHTPKPKRFSIHTRYYNQDKLSEKASIEKGMFTAKRRRGSKFHKPDIDMPAGAVQKSSSVLYKIVMYGVLLAVAVLSVLYVKFGWIIAVSIVALLLAFTNRR